MTIDIDRRAITAGQLACQAATVAAMNTEAQKLLMGLAEALSKSVHEALNPPFLKDMSTGKIIPFNRGK